MIANSSCRDLATLAIASSIRTVRITEAILMRLPRDRTRDVRTGSVTVGARHPLAVQSMTAKHTQDIDATVALVNFLDNAGADIVRIAVDSKKDAEALAE